MSDLFGKFVRPMLQSVDGNDAKQIIELPGHKVVDDGFRVGALDSVSRYTLPLLKRSITR